LKKPSTTRIVWIASIGGMLLVLALVALATPFYCDRGYICNLTGSRKGYREWFFGMETGHWQKESALDAFMQEHYSKELRHQWIDYEGTGRNIFGWAVSRAHGSPGYIIVLPESTLDAYVQKNSERENKALYDLLTTGDENSIRAKLDQISKTTAFD
jgi:hypothetical protein